jgi:uncharacterized protein with NRDE domain
VSSDGSSMGSSVIVDSSWEKVSKHRSSWGQKVITPKKNCSLFSIMFYLKLLINQNLIIIISNLMIILKSVILENVLIFFISSLFTK